MLRHEKTVAPGATLQLTPALPLDRALTDALDGTEHRARAASVWHEVGQVIAMPEKRADTPRKWRGGERN